MCLSVTSPTGFHIEIAQRGEIVLSEVNQENVYQRATGGIC
jgi:hypothetical protein